MARGRLVKRRRHDVAQLDVAGLAGRRVAAGHRLQPVEQVDEPAMLGQRVEHELGALRDRDVRMAAQRRQRRLDARQRRAQLVAGVGREAPRRGERALAVGRRPPEPREHVVEARRQRAQLGRPVVAGHALVEILGARDPRRRRAQAPQRREQQGRREPRADAAEQQRDQAEPREPAIQRRELALDRPHRRRDLEAREALEPGDRDPRDVRAVAPVAGAERVHAVLARDLRRRAPAARTRATGPCAGSRRSDVRLAISALFRRLSFRSPSSSACSSVSRDSSAVRLSRSSSAARSERAT